MNQDLDGLDISGRSYDHNREFHGHWTSEATSVDVRKGQLIFTYEFEVLSRPGPLRGVSTFLFRRGASHKAPDALSGFAHDLNDNKRIYVHEEKLSDEYLSWDQALEKAVEKFSWRHTGIEL